MGVDPQSAVPPGPLQSGQALRLCGRAYARRLCLRMEIDAVDEAKGVIDMRVMLPLGMINHEHMTLAPVLDGGRPACRVQLG